jgi:hypothetical protein
VLIYGILFVSDVLGKIKPGMARREAEKVGSDFVNVVVMGWKFSEQEFVLTK